MHLYSCEHSWWRYFNLVETADPTCIVVETADTNLNFVEKADKVDNAEETDDKGLNILYKQLMKI